MISESLTLVTDYSVSYLILSASVITDRHSRPFLNAFALEFGSRVANPARPKVMPKVGSKGHVNALKAQRGQIAKGNPFRN